ncbi:MAG: hypothetical protein P8H39_12850 [Thalassotalea sp.]|nr:hypothetical protein [Thalassotalea sp.]
MKRKTTVLLLSLFFVSSVVAISSVNNGSQMAIIADYDPSVEDYAVDSYVQVDSNQANVNEENTYTDTNEDLVAQVESTEQVDIDYQTDSDILLVESKADKARLKKQKQEAERQRQAKLTQQLNEETKIALQKRLQQNGEPAKSLGTEQAVASAAQSEEINRLTSQTTNQPQVAALTTEQQVTLKRKALNLAPPIPPGTLGGGNGNGGPGAASTTSASAN